MSLSYIFSLVFFIAFTIYLILGIYIISANPKSMLNLLFFIACILLSIWAFCFSIANSAQDYEMAIFWSRLTSLGWGTVYSILLHFFLVLTGRKKILKSKWLYMVLYVPAVFNIFIFCFSDLATKQYELINTNMGWINVSGSSWGALYFNLYYASFTIAGFCLIWNWGKKSKEVLKKKQANLFINSYAVAIVMGTMTDIIVNKYTSFKVLPMAPVIVLLPTISIFYAIKRYGLMGLEKNDRSKPGEILSEVNMERFINIMALVYIIGGMLYFASQYFFNQKHPNFNSILWVSFLFFVIAIMLMVIKLLPIKEKLKEFIFILIMLLSILLITINFIESASITVWAAPFIIVMLSVLFNKRLMIFWIGVLILMTQVYVWVKIPIALVQVDGSDHLVRIGILSITLSLAYFVNRVYIQRLEENENQIKFQKLVSQISTDFVKVSEPDLDEKIKGMLELIGQHFRVDRTFFIGLTPNIKKYEWYNEGLEALIDRVPDMNSDTYPWWVNQMLNNAVINIQDARMLPPEAAAEKAVLEYLNIKSQLAIPVRSKGKILGFLFFASVKVVNNWQENHRELMEILANLLSDALVKVEAEKEISYMAYYDALTGLPNQTLFKNRLEQAIHLAKRSGNLIGVVFIDLDSFKSVNDTIGHLGGDEMLKQVSARISGCLRKHDTVSRFGGDEFLIKLTQIDRVEDIKKIAEKIMKAFAQPVTIKAQEFFVTASVGVAVYPIDGEEPEVLIKNADLAMYASKERGKNQYTLCSPAMKEDVLEKMHLTNSLYRAQERNELELYYQPQVSASTKEIVGFEALIRWNNPDLGIISPATFIPLAEQNGLIIPIGQWVIETACRQNKAWQDMGLSPIRMAVNLSVIQFKDRNLINIIDAALNETKLEPKYLELEITESAVGDGADDIIHVLHQLKALGVTISIDDFGTEYSSLNRLKTLPVDRIKIDMQFVHGIKEGNKDEAIAKTIIQLAKNLKLNVIAEGVETQSQLEFFNEYKCDEIQGYFFYKPMPASEIEAILFNQINK